MAAKTSAQMRNSELAKIHIAVKDLGYDRDTYEDILWTVCRVRSSADLDSKGRFKLLAHFEHLGWKSGRKKEPKRTKMTADQLGKIEALLADASRPWAYAHGMARQMFKQDRLEWITVAEARKLIAALEYDAQKRGLRSSIEEQLQELGKDKQFIQGKFKLPDASWWNKIKTLRAIDGYLADLIEEQAVHDNCAAGLNDE